MYQMQEDESLFFEINGKEVDNAGQMANYSNDPGYTLRTLLYVWDDSPSSRNLRLTHYS